MQHPFRHSCSLARRTAHDTLCLKRAPCSHAAGPASPKGKPRQGQRGFVAGFPAPCSGGFDFGAAGATLPAVPCSVSCASGHVTTAESRRPVSMSVRSTAIMGNSELMTTGLVKFFNADRGYGFIAPDGGGSDVFVHVHEVESAGIKTLVKGQPLTYNNTYTRDGRLKGRQSSLA